jgi:hypothetical protein
MKDPFPLILNSPRNHGFVEDWGFIFGEWDLEIKDLDDVAGMMVGRGNYPNIAEHLRLVTCYNLPGKIYNHAKNTKDLPSSNLT